jgi:hypothetical protein
MTDIPRVVGITGLAGSGKTLASNWVVRNHNNAIRMSFARPIKRMIRELIREAIPKTSPVKEGDYLEDPAHKNAPIPFLANYSARRLMQTLGTEWGREALHPDFWVLIAAGKLERLMASPFKSSKSTPLNAVFDDVRFENEARMIRAYGGFVMRIERPGVASVGDHASESMAFEPDMVLVNDGTPEDLYEKLAVLLPPTVP